MSLGRKAENERRQLAPKPRVKEGGGQVGRGPGRAPGRQREVARGLDVA